MNNKYKEAFAFRSSGTQYNRTQLEYFLERAGLRWNKNNEMVINHDKQNFIKDCIRDDLGIGLDLPLEFLWYETGNAFALATDMKSNHTIQIQLGRKSTVFETGFDKKKSKFLGLYYNRKLVTEEVLKQLL